MQDEADYPCAMYSDHKNVMVPFQLQPFYCTPKGFVLPAISYLRFDHFSDGSKMACLHNTLFHIKLTIIHKTIYKQLNHLLFIFEQSITYLMRVESIKCLKCMPSFLKL